MVAAFLFGVVVLATPDQKPAWDNSCDGPGFGCTPNPRAGLLIVAMHFSPLLCVAVATSLAALPILIRMRIRSGWVLGPLSAIAGMGLTACAVAGYVAALPWRLMHRYPAMTPFGSQGPTPAG